LQQETESGRKELSNSLFRLLRPYEMPASGGYFFFRVVLLLGLMDTQGDTRTTSTRTPSMPDSPPDVKAWPKSAIGFNENAASGRFAKRLRAQAPSQRKTVIGYRVS
jgi:hypothetical protein